MLNNKAFSLLETLIALHIVTFFIGLILPTFLLYQTKVQNVKLNLNIELLAHNKLIDIELTNDLPVNGDFKYKQTEVLGEFVYKNNLVEYCITYSDKFDQRKEQCLYAKK